MGHVLLLLLCLFQRSKRGCCVCRRIGCVLRMKSRLVFIADGGDTDVEKRCGGSRKDGFTITCGSVKVVGLDGVLQEHQMA